MNTIKTSELTGAALDWAVAKCEGRDRTYLDYFASQWHLNKSLRYSTDWSQGGTIIERERIDVFYEKHTTGSWCGSAPRGNKVGWRYLQYGHTPLIAAMRCYVASKLGDTIEVPKELM